MVCRVVLCVGGVLPIFPTPFKLPLLPFPPFPPLVQTPRPALFGGGPSRAPPSWKAFLAGSPPHVPLTKERSLACLVYVYFYPFLFPSAKPDSKGTQTDVCATCFRIPQGKQLTWRSLRPPFFPTGWPPCFQNTKWRHVAWILR